MAVGPATPGAHGWERNKQQTRLALIWAAIRLFREHGYETTTVDDIASAAGCSRRTFFRYFGTKEDVLLLDTREMLSEFRAFVSHPVPGLTRWDQIRVATFTAIRRLAEPSSGVEELIIASWLTEPAIAKHFSVILAELERTIALALAEERGADPDQDLTIQFVARATVAAVTAALHVHIHRHGKLENEFEQVFALLEGCMPPLYRP
ncbi:MAG TPA: TetR family transcriptional regulator [Pseudonocardia sp.]|jgi:AcrR family transcriptional regulator